MHCQTCSCYPKSAEGASSYYQFDAACLITLCFSIFLFRSCAHWGESCCRSSMVDRYRSIRSASICIARQMRLPPKSTRRVDCLRTGTLQTCSSKPANTDLGGGAAENPLRRIHRIRQTQMCTDGRAIIQGQHGHLAANGTCIPSVTHLLWPAIVVMCIFWRTPSIPSFPIPLQTLFMNYPIVGHQTV